MNTTTIRHDTASRHIAKYHNENPLHRLSLKRFHDRLASRIGTLAPRSVLDFGCGEGFTPAELARRGVVLEDYEGVDLRSDCLTAARSRWPKGQYIQADIFDQSFDDRRYDVTIALEVFEHLLDPRAALKRLVELTERALVISVPHEPWFQIVNLLRGRDFIRLGNHPEHVQHWNLATFSEFLSQHMDDVRIVRSFPFIIASGRPRR